MTPEAEALLVGYPWHGNVRELHNCVEYLAYLDQKTIEAKDLKLILKWPETARKPEDAPLSGFFGTTGIGREEYVFILESLFANHQAKQRSGRRSLVQMAQKQDLFLTEAQIRKALVRLEQAGLVRMNYGRGGSTITALGIQEVKQLRIEAP
jgi:DNA-binding NtrC family response regulator